MDFIGTVILLIQHSEEQAFGVILNRPTTTAVKEAWKGKRRCQCEGMVYSGGQVTSPLMALVEYSLDEEGRMTVENDTARWYRYIDMTPRAESLFRFIERTIDTELVQELDLD